jgi:hypothetical protein
MDTFLTDFSLLAFNCSCFSFEFEEQDVIIANRMKRRSLEVIMTEFINDLSF